MAITDYTPVADDNTQISGINIAEGCPPSGINDAIRQIMADLAGVFINGLLSPANGGVGARVYVRANGTYTNVRNIASVTKTGTGRYHVEWATPIPGGCIQVSILSVNPGIVTTGNGNLTGCDVFGWSPTGVAADVPFMLSVA